MQNKRADIPYCGVSQQKIREAKPKLNVVAVKHLYDFVTERYKIHIRKDFLKQKAPWTKNPILSQYKFCNIRREHDRQSQYLIKNISTNSCLSLEDKIVNSFYFRAWNNWDTMKDFGGPWPAKCLYSSQMKEQVRPIYQQLASEDPDRKWWSSAYNQCGTKQAWRYPDPNEKINKEDDIPLRVFHIGPWLKEHNTVEKLLSASDQKAAFEAIKEIQGFADFLAYQIFVDLTYIEEFPFSENEFVVAGPGCQKGLNKLFDDYDWLTFEEALFWLADNIDEIFNEVHPPFWAGRLFVDLPQEDRFFSVMCLENCMCEFCKYIRTVEGNGRPRVKYKQHE